ncbi:MAG: arsenate reductase ArsC [Acidobacteriota bacterium]
MAKKRSVLILCTGNSARSQMAEGLLRHICGDRYDIYSAGTAPSSVRREPMAVMLEVGIDISDNRSKSVDEFAGREIDYVLTVCDNAQENCPYFPARTTLIHRDFEEPAEVRGDEETRFAAFRRARDQIREYLETEFILTLDAE